MIRSCVIGHPVAHSRSPLIHGYWLKRYGIEGIYERRDVAPELLADFIASLPGSELAGCNVTLPHKETAARLVTHPDPKARRIGSANTLYVKNGDVHATSTDGEGFIANLISAAPQLSFAGATVLIIGAGGSARALVDELCERGAAQVWVANRTLARAEEIARPYGGRAQAIPLAAVTDRLPHTALLVNTTSAGIADDQRLEVDFARLPREAIVTDINYVPLVTPFLSAARAHGLKTIGGLGMLLHQAVPGFELWFGKRPEVTDELYDLVARDVDPDFTR